MAGLGRRTHYRKHLTDSVLYDFPEPLPDECIAKIVSTRGSNQFDVILANNNTNTNNTLDSAEQQQPSQLALLPTKFRKLVWLKRNDYVIVQTIASTTTSTSSTAVEQEEQDKQGAEPTLDTTGSSSNNNNNNNGNTGSSSDSGGGGGIRNIITHILYKDQIKHLQAKGLWPMQDKEFQQAVTTAAAEAEGEGEAGGGEDNDNGGVPAMDGKLNDDGIVYDENYHHNNDDNDDQFDSDNDDEDYDNGDIDKNNNNMYFVNTNRISSMKIQDSSSEEDDSD